MHLCLQLAPIERTCYLSWTSLLTHYQVHCSTQWSHTWQCLPAPTTTWKASQLRTSIWSRSRRTCHIVLICRLIPGIYSSISWKRMHRTLKHNCKQLAKERCLMRNSIGLMLMGLAWLIRGQSWQNQRSVRFCRSVVFCQLLWCRQLKAMRHRLCRDKLLKIKTWPSTRIQVSVRCATRFLPTSIS